MNSGTFYIREVPFQYLHDNDSGKAIITHSPFDTEKKGFEVATLYVPGIRGTKLRNLLVEQFTNKDFAFAAEIEGICTAWEGDMKKGKKEVVLPLAKPTEAPAKTVVLVPVEEPASEFYDNPYAAPRKKSAAKKAAKTPAAAEKKKPGPKPKTSSGTPKSEKPKKPVSVKTPAKKSAARKPGNK